ncbi:MAG: hypothetical protein K8I27_00835 [Planctomycetes bacterium]|nr:hypothetical protein [Planctomycetota bacterium]
MAVPSEIRKLIGDRRVKAHASLSCSFQGPIGETHFIVADGQLFVFERESLIGDFRPVALDPSHPPSIEKGTFDDTLHVTFADGVAHQLRVSSFDRDALEHVLLEHASAPPVETIRESTIPADNPPVATQETLDQAPAEALHLKPAPPRSRVTPRSQPPAPDSDTEAEAKADAEAEKAGRGKKDKGVYHGSDPGCAGCLIQAALFFGGILALWFLHEQAMLNTGVVQPEDTYDDSAVFVITKIVAVIAGIYLGGKSASLFGALAAKLNWTGHVAFVQGRVIVTGQRGKWQVSIDRSRPFELEGGAFSSIEASTDDKGRPNKRTFQVYVRLAQDGQDGLLRTSYSRAAPPESIAGVQLQLLKGEWEHQRILTMNEKTFRNIVKRVSESR